MSQTEDGKTKSSIQNGEKSTDKSEGAQTLPVFKKKLTSARLSEHVAKEFASAQFRKKLMEVLSFTSVVLKIVVSSLIIIETVRNFDNE